MGGTSDRGTIGGLNRECHMLVLVYFCFYDCFNSVLLQTNRRKILTYCSHAPGPFTTPSLTPGRPFNPPVAHEFGKY